MVKQKGKIPLSSSQWDLHLLQASYNLCIMNKLLSFRCTNEIAALRLNWTSRKVRNPIGIHTVFQKIRAKYHLISLRTKNFKDLIITTKSVGTCFNSLSKIYQFKKHVTHRKEVIIRERPWGRLRSLNRHRIKRVITLCHILSRISIRGLLPSRVRIKKSSLKISKYHPETTS